jgi:AcrR family transcriptional regulator
MLSRIMTGVNRRVKQPQQGRPTRRDRALATRRRICAAATRLFVETGYTATTMDEIAAAAGVAVQTVYFVFHTKGELLRAVFDAAVLGDVNAPPPQEQLWFQRILDEPDPVRLLALFVDANAAILRRVGPLVAVVQSSGVAEVRALFEDRERLRWEGFHEVATRLQNRELLAVPTDEAADVLFALVGPQLHALLRQRGWSDRKWRAWTTSTLQASLLRPTNATRR